MASGRTDNNGGSLERLLLPDEAAKILKLSISWLAKARMDGTGPEFVKFGRAVRYKQSSLIKYIKEQTRTNTNEHEHKTPV